MKSKDQILDLFDILSEASRVFIQAHNFPDHDAIAAAFGLQKLMERFNVKAGICYDGSLERESLKMMIKDLGIQVLHASESGITGDDYIVIVDSCKDNKNVTALEGKVAAVIDHHVIKADIGAPFVDIRSAYGSTSTIVYEYYLKTHQTLSKNVATAMMIGLIKDTAGLTRGVSYHDIIAHSDLWHHANMEYVHRMMKNDIQKEDLSFFQTAISLFRMEKNFGYIFFEDGCAQNLLGIIGDFFMSVHDLDFIAVIARNNGKINLSIRSEETVYNAAEVIETVLEGIGFGGGHEDMAGGIIEDYPNLSSEDICNKFKKVLGII